MPWIKKIKYPKTGKPHYCKVPGCSGRAKKLDVGSSWRCRKCGRVWRVIAVKKWSWGVNSRMTWESTWKTKETFSGYTYKLDPKIIERFHPALTDP